MKNIGLLFFLTLALSLGSKAQTNQKQSIWYVTDLPIQKLNQQNGPQIKTIESAPEKIEDIGLKPMEKEFQYFKISNSNKMLVIKSLEFYRKEQNNEI